MRFFKCSQIEIKLQATVVDGDLVLTLPQALTPVVWRLELGQTKSASFLLEEADKGYALIHKSAHGKAKEIALFSDRDLAMEALMITARALEKQSLSALPQKKAANDSGFKNSATAHTKAKRSFMPLLVGAALVALCFFVFSAIKPQTTTFLEQARFEAPSAQTGVPVSADQFLGEAAAYGSR